MKHSLYISIDDRHMKSPLFFTYPFSLSPSKPISLSQLIFKFPIVSERASEETVERRTNGRTNEERIDIQHSLKESLNEKTTTLQSRSPFFPFTVSFQHVTPDAVIEFEKDHLFSFSFSFSFFYLYLFFLCGGK